MRKYTVLKQGTKRMEYSNHFVINDGYTTFPSALNDRFVVTSQRQNSNWIVPRQTGFHRWHVGDFASVHMKGSLPWTLVELRIIEVIDAQSYRMVVTKFDGRQQSISGLSLGDEVVVNSACFYALWGPGQSREDGEGSQKVYAEGTNRRFKDLHNSAIKTDEKILH